MLSKILSGQSGTEKDNGGQWKDFTGIPPLWTGATAVLDMQNWIIDLPQPAGVHKYRRSSQTGNDRVI